MERAKEALRQVAERVGALRAAIDKHTLVYKALGSSPHGAELTTVLAEAAALPFTDGRWRAHLFAPAEGGGILLLSADAALIDQTGLDAVLAAVTATLAGGGAGGAIPAVAAAMRGNSAFWREQLKNAPAETGIIPDKARPAALSGRRRTASLSLDANAARAVLDAAKASGTAVDAWFAAAFTAFINRFGRSEDIVVGLADGHVTLPLRMFPDRKAPFATLVAKVEAALAAARPQGAPSAADLGIEDDPSRHPLLQAALAVVVTDGEPLSEALAVLPACGRLDLEILVRIGHGGAQLVLAGAADLFEGATIARYLRHFATLIAAAAAAPGTELGRLSLLTGAERRHLLEDFNQTDYAFPRHETLHGLLEAQAAKTPGRTALIVGDLLMSYREFNAEANRLARHLRGLGVRDGVMVGLCLEKSAELIISVFAILKAGGAYVPLDPAYPKERLGVMLDDAELPFLVTTARLASRLPPCAARLVDWETERGAIAAQSPDDLSKGTASASQASLAYMIYTSGSTGKPKGVLVPHETVVNFLYSMAKVVDFKDDEVTLSANTISFDIVIPDLFLNFMAGGTLVVAPKDAALDGAMVAELLDRHRVTNMLATPSTWRILLDAGWQGSKDLRIIAAGEALPPSLAKVLKGLGKSLWNGYGPTEITVIATYYKVEDLERPMYVGLPIDNTYVYILDEHKEPVPVGVPGELFIAGAGVTRGYLKRPELTAERFLPNPFSDKFGGRMYKTGDLGRFAPDGHIEYLGRNDDQVKLRGFRIELGDIEAVTLTHPAVDKAVIMVREDGAGDQRLVAYYTLAAGADMQAAELRLHIAAQLPQHMVPNQFVKIDAMPLNPNGKVDKRALPEPPEERQDFGAVYAAPKNAVEEALGALWRELLKVNSVGIDDNFFEMGGNSLLAVRMVARLKKEYGMSVPVLKLFEFPTIAGLAGCVEVGERTATAPNSALTLTSTPTPKSTEDGDRRIAIIGAALRFPGAETLAQFWDNLVRGAESIDFWAPHELDPGIDPALLESPHYVRARGVIKDGDKFDHVFFGISMREAEVMDPAQRLFLEIAWSALEDGGYTPDSYAGDIGVYAGTGTNTYFSEIVRKVPGLIESVGAFTTMLANEKDYVTTRTAHRLNLKGPGVSVQTACSTSLVAIHLAVQALRNGECTLAIAGGSTSTAPLKSGYLYQEGGMLSPDGHTRSFDDDAKGTVFSDGVGALLLKRLADAERDGDRILAVIAGSAINNDGGAKASFTAPSIDGQAAVVTAALRDARLSPNAISYVEAHGTATPLGDPIELAALLKAFTGGANATKDLGFCALGSLKSNLGHMVASAGVGGVLKTALALNARQIPPTINFTRATTKIDLDASPFRVNDRLSDWQARLGARRAGVSSFGVGGTNAHVILEEAPAARASEAPARKAVLVPLSAKTEPALAALRERLWRHCADRGTMTAAEIADLAFTMQIGRKPLAHRATIVATDAETLKAALGDQRSPRAQKRAVPARAPEVVFLFPGQGVQSPQMGLGLYASEPAYRTAFDACAAEVRRLKGVDLVQLLRGDGDGDKGRLNATEFAQPAIFAVEYACAQLWLAKGVKPRILIGHSVGELVAATIAGVMELTAALALVCERARLMQGMAAGSMLSVRMKAEELRPHLGEALSLSAVNSPVSSVVGGAPDAVSSLQKKLELQHIACKLLITSHAFHTPMMAPATTALATAAGKAGLKPPRLPIVSTVTGTWLKPAEATDPAFWAAQIERPVLFADAVQTLAEGPDRLFLECGPRETLSALSRQQLGPASPHRFAGTLGATASETAEADDLAFAQALGAVWLAGIAVDWGAHYGTERRRRVALPTYPFERIRVWPVLPEIKKSSTNVHNGAPMTGLGKMQAESRKPRLLSEVKALLEEASGIAAHDAPAEATFLELGLDSLFLTQFALKLQRKYALKITFRQLLEQYASFGALVDLIDGHLPPDAAPRPALAQAAAVLPITDPYAEPAPASRAPEPAVSGNAPMPAYAASAHPAAAQALYAQPTAAMPAMSAPQVPMTGLDAIVSQQLHIMARQLEMLSGRPMQMVQQAPMLVAAVAQAFAPPPVAPAAPPASPAAPEPAAPAKIAASTKQKEVYDAKKAFGAAARITLTEEASLLSAKQKKAFDDFLVRYTLKTRESKRLTQFYRPWLADPRVVTGFRPPMKELIYQVIIERSKGSRMWDVDGNEYVDALCGFGMNFFGWSADFINDMVKEQLEKGIDIGPMTPLAGEVAKLLCEMTGFDRAGFCNTGSEAVMGCMRIARTVTGRDKIAIFAGSYHGIFDEVIVRGTKSGKAIPAAPGIMASTAENVVVLEYGSPEAIAYIRANAHDLAAVIAEPVQSRRADFQPKEFLQEIRKITEQNGCALVFDEVITGFRLAQGGAQQHFGIKADLASYGKVIGGGFPIGVIAGKKAWADALDGGHWKFGDDSKPEVGVTYFAGTFVRHPPALAAAKAVLLHLKEKGPGLQQEMNAKTAAFATELNAHFKAVGLPMICKHMGSLWRCTFTEEMAYGDLLFCWMRYKGVHMWDGFPCFFTTAHTADDIAFIMRSWKESIAEMQQGDLLPGSSAGVTAAKMTGTAGNVAEPPVPGARLGRDDKGFPAWFVPDPNSPGKFMKVN